MQTQLRMEVRTLVERATRWLVNNRRRPIDIGAAVEQLAAGVQAVQHALPRHADRPGPGCPRPAAEALPRGRGARGARQRGRRAAGRVRRADDRPDGRPQRSVDVLKVAEVHFALGQRLGLDRLLSPDRRAAARRPLADHGPGRAARRPARGARPAHRRRAQVGRATRRSSPRRSCRRLGEGEHRRARVGQDPAVDHRRTGPTWPGCRSACGSSGGCCRPWPDRDGRTVRCRTS